MLNTQDKKVTEEKLEVLKVEYFNEGPLRPGAKC